MVERRNGVYDVEQEHHPSPISSVGKVTSDHQPDPHGSSSRWRWMDQTSKLHMVERGGRRRWRPELGIARRHPFIVRRTDRVRWCPCARPATPARARAGGAGGRGTEAGPTAINTSLGLVTYVATTTFYADAIAAAAAAAAPALSSSAASRSRAPSHHHARCGSPLM